MAYSPRHLVAAVVAMLGVLFAAAVLLASFHEDVRTARTRSHLERGHALARQNELAAAVEQYRTALSLEPDDPQARRALALTLLSLGHLGEAESHVRDLLKEDPTDGPLNRALARIHVLRDRAGDARAAYQRAVYGVWPAEAGGERIATRFELIDYLARLNVRQELLAELVRLKAELPAGDTAAARRLADLLVSVRAPDLAVETLEAAATAAPRDAELLAQLADVQTETGRYTAARATLRRALVVEPRRAELGARLAVIDRVLELDPTLPRLRLVTRTRRARLVLSAVLEQTRACEPEGAPSEPRRLARLRLRRPARADAEAAEQDLSLAQQLWAAAPACHNAGPEARALEQILQRIDATREPPS